MQRKNFEQRGDMQVLEYAIGSTMPFQKDTDWKHVVLSLSLASQL